MPIVYFDDIDGVEAEPTGPIVDRPLHDEDEDIQDDGFEDLPISFNSIPSEDGR